MSSAKITLCTNVVWENVVHFLSMVMLWLIGVFNTNHWGVIKKEIHEVTVHLHFSQVSNCSWPVNGKIRTGFWGKQLWSAGSSDNYHLCGGGPRRAGSLHHSSGKQPGQNMCWERSAYDLQFLTFKLCVLLQFIIYASYFFAIAVIFSIRGLFSIWNAQRTQTEQLPEDKTDSPVCEEHAFWIQTELLSCAFASHHLKPLWPKASFK